MIDSLQSNADRLRAALLELEDQTDSISQDHIQEGEELGSVDSFLESFDADCKTGSDSPTQLNTLSAGASPVHKFADVHNTCTEHPSVVLSLMPFGSAPFLIAAVFLFSLPTGGSILFGSSICQLIKFQQRPLLQAF